LKASKIGVPVADCFAPDRLNPFVDRSSEQFSFVTVTDNGFGEVADSFDPFTFEKEVEVNDAALLPFHDPGPLNLSDFVSHRAAEDVESALRFARLSSECERRHCSPVFLRVAESESATEPRFF
jgi:hypothetical protein